MTELVAERAPPASAEGHWRSLRAAAVDRYRGDPSDRFGWRFARGKLAFDPVFRHLVDHGLVPPGARVLDLGCGQGLVGAVVAAANDAARAGRWPAGGPPAPLGASVTGIELMPRDAMRARTALGRHPGEVVCGDLRVTPLPPSDVVVILDVLHYLDPAAQDDMLARVRRALPPRGRLLLRVGDAGAGRPFAASRWVDRLVARVRRGTPVALHGRPLAAWIERLRSLGFDVASRPMSRGTPFANVLLVAEVQA